MEKNRSKLNPIRAEPFGKLRTGVSKLDPPGVQVVFQGLRVGPKRRLWVAPSQPKVGVLVLPSCIAPAARSRATIGASSLGTLSAYRRVPQVVRIPLVGTISLVEKGTPWSGPRVASLLH